jgi:hypothetical protein
VLDQILESQRPVFDKSGLGFVEGTPLSPATFVLGSSSSTPLTPSPLPTQVVPPTSADVTVLPTDESSSPKAKNRTKVRKTKCKHCGRQGHNKSRCWDLKKSVPFLPPPSYGSPPPWNATVAMPPTSFPPPRQPPFAPWNNQGWNSPYPSWNPFPMYPTPPHPPRLPPTNNRRFPFPKPNGRPTRQPVVATPSF